MFYIFNTTILRKSTRELTGTRHSTLNVLQTRRIYMLGSKIAVKTLEVFVIIFRFVGILSILVKK